LPFFSDDIETCAKADACKCGDKISLLLSEGKKNNGAENRDDHQEDELKQFRPLFLDMRQLHNLVSRRKQTFAIHFCPAIRL
jgi:hypothetical protein